MKEEGVPAPFLTAECSTPTRIKYFIGRARDIRQQNKKKKRLCHPETLLKGKI
jgi:hypothetical protein